MKKQLNHFLSELTHPSNRGLVFISVLMLFLFVELSGFLNTLINQGELWDFSLRQRYIHERRHDSHIDIIGLDDYTLTSPKAKELFGRSPFRRDIYAYLVRFINRADAKYLALDLGFSGGKDQRYPEADEAFAQSVRESNIPVGSVISANSGSSDRAPLNSVSRAANKSKVHLSGTLNKVQASINNIAQEPLDTLVDTPMHFLFSNSLKSDPSQIVRYVNVFTTLDFPPSPDNLSPTLPLAIALHGEKNITVLPNGDLQTPTQLFKLQGESSPIIKWYGDNREHSSFNHNQTARQKSTLGPISTMVYNFWNQTITQHTPLQGRKIKHIYPTYSLWDVIYTELTLTCKETPSASICKTFASNPSNKPMGQLVDPALFKDHIVLVGTNYENSPGDVHSTIYSGNHYHGVYIQANILDNFLHNDFIKKAPTLLTWAVSIFFAILIGLTAYHRPILYSMILFSSIIGSYSFISLWVYQEYNLWINWAYPVLATTLTFMASFAIRYFSAERRKQKLRFAFGKYVSPGAMKLIEKDPDKLSLGGQRQELTILFTDIRGFTNFSETSSPEDVQYWLTEYFSVMNAIIFKHNGAINKLMGDAIMAYWGFPVADEQSPLNAVKAALEMRDAMIEWNKDPNKPCFNIGVGINTGDVIIGNVGSKDFMDFTVIGDAVNIAARLESENKTQQTTVIISQQTLNYCPPHLKTRPLGHVTVKGKQQPVEIYEPTELSVPTQAEDGLNQQTV